MKRLFYNFMICCFLVGGTSSVCAQQVILNTNGEQIVIYPDGSWRYYEEADSVLLKKNLKKEEIFVRDNDPTNPFENPATNPDEIEDLMRLAAEFADLTETQRRDASIALSQANGDKFEIEAQLEQANANKSLVEPDRIGTLEDAYDEKVEEVKAAKKHLKVLTSFAMDARKIQGLSAPRMEKSLSKLMAEHSAYHGEQNVVIEQEPAQDQGVTPPDAEPEPREKTPKPSATIADNSGDPFEAYQREAPYCNIIQQQIDPNSRELRVTVERALFFTHTDDELRPYFRQQELVTCNGQLTQIDDNVFLSTEFSIASPNARKNFGSLAKGSLLRIRLLDKSEVNLYNTRADRGRIDPYTGNTLFVGQYLIEKDAIKALEEREIVGVRVVWSTGYEDYDVYELDFFINQFACLNSVR